MNSDQNRMLITGASGYIGRHLADFLGKACPDADLRLIGRSHVDVDLTSEKEVLDLFHSFRPSVVFHLAGKATTSNWSELIQCNVATSAQILHAARSLGNSCRIILAGTAAEYGPTPADQLPTSEDRELLPRTPYGISKVLQSLLVERFAATAGLSLIVARFFNLIGPGMPDHSAIGNFAAQIREIQLGARTELLANGNLDDTRDFIDIEDACRALLALSQLGVPAGTYNVCSGRETLIRDVLGLMISTAKIDPETPIVQATHGSSTHKSLTSRSCGSYRKLQRAAAWCPEVPLEISIRRIFP